MRRYAKTKSKIDKSGVRVYRTTYYPSIPISDDDKFIRVKVGDRLDTLAHRFYKDVTLWWILAKANNIKGIGALKPGPVIRIPANISDIIESFNALNERR